MRIFLSCLQALHRHPLPAYEFWREYFVRGAEEAGIAIAEAPGVDWAEGLLYSDHKQIQAWRGRTWTRVLEYIKAEHNRQPIDMFLGYLYPQQVEESAVRELQRLGIPCVNFFCDNVREFTKVPAAYRCFDLHWVPEFEALLMYRAAGLPHIHAPMPVWIPPGFRTANHPEIDPPMFIGSPDVLRRHLLGAALAAGANFVVRGPGWHETPGVSNVTRPCRSSILSNQLRFIRAQGGAAWLRRCQQRLQPIKAQGIPAERIGNAVFGSSYLEKTQNAMITIGINRVPTFWRSLSNPLTYSRLRDIEAPMLGACYLTEWTQGLPLLYELGEEIETYRTAEELAEKISELEKNAEKRQKMRHKSQQKALEHHSVRRSLQKIIATLS